jgi:predicted RNase H-like nuclease (RuvC/YqgF family)
MNSKMQNFETSFEKLAAAVFSSADKIAALKRKNRELTGEVNEMKRLLALHEKKAARMQKELDKAKKADEKSWQTKEKDIKKKLMNLSAKLSAFEKSYSIES